MRDNSIHSFYQVMTGQIYDQLALGSFRWFTVAMAWVMFFGGLAIAWYNWSKDPEQRSAHHFFVFLMRFLGRHVVSGHPVEAALAGRAWL